MNTCPPPIPAGVAGKQLVKYALVGLASNAAGYLVYLLITHAGMPPKTAMSFLYAVGATAGYFGNRTLTFAYKGGMFGSGIRYLITHLVGYLMNLAILVTFVDFFGYPHQLVQATAVLVVAAYLFIAFKLFVFRTRKAGSVGDTV
jgi:putative flippase GtrA